MKKLTEAELSKKMQWEKQLFSADEKIVLSTIDKIAKSGKLWILPALFQLRANSGSETINNAVFNLLINIKNSDAIPYFIDAIQEQSLLKIQAKLVSSCWQTGLDFSAYELVFAQLFLEKEFATAFEAFTVLENMNSFKNKTKLLDKLKQDSNLQSEEKQFLLSELIDIIERK